MLHLHVFLSLKSLHTFYSLLIFLKTCEHLFKGNPFYLCNWQMRYSRMTWLFLISYKVHGIYFTKQNSNSMFLEWHSNTYQGHIYDLTWQNLPQMPLTLYWVWSSFVTPVERCFMLPRSKLTYTPQIISYSYTKNTLKHVFHHNQNKYSMI